MPEQDTPQSVLQAAKRSRKLHVSVIALAILPLVLPFPFYGLAVLWIRPVIEEIYSGCASFDCLNATYPVVTSWLDLWCLLVLGPSLLVALASILLGTIGLIRARRHPTSPENKNLFSASVGCGLIWAVLLGGMLLFGFGFLVPFFAQPVG